MAVRWTYETRTGWNICIGQTTDDTATTPTDDNEADYLRPAFTPGDPSAPDGLSLVPQKRYVSETNTVQEANAAQIQDFNVFVKKKEKNLEIDRNTMRLFNKGLVYDGATFPLGVDDSLNYLRMYTQRNASETWPKDIAQRNRNAYTIDTAAAMKQFGEAAFDRQREIVDGAQALKKQIFDATTVAAVNAIQDNRS